MKNVNFCFSRILLLILIVSGFSCQKNGTEPKPAKASATGNNTQALAATPVTIFSSNQHQFTDVQVCYDNNVFLLENGKLKKLVGTQLVDMFPASVYTDFNPQYLAISKDFTFYLRAANGIKVIKGGKEIKYYKVGVAPLQDFNEASFGNWELSVDETDQSIVFGIGTINAELMTLGKITTDGHYSRLTLQGMTDDFDIFITSFGIGGTPGTLWDCGLAASSNSFYGKLFKSALTSPPYTYTLLNTYGIGPTNHTSPPFEGAITEVDFGILACIEVSKDGKVLYLKTGDFGDDNPDPNGGISSHGQIYKILDNQVTLVADDVTNKRLAISNDGKTLYIAGVNGLSKIEF
jgi:hypothetical protein